GRAGGGVGVRYTDPGGVAAAAAAGVAQLRGRHVGAEGGGPAGGGVLHGLARAVRDSLKAGHLCHRRGGGWQRSERAESILALDLAPTVPDLCNPPAPATQSSTPQQVAPPRETARKAATGSPVAGATELRNPSPSTRRAGTRS